MDEDIKKLVAENLELTKSIQNQTAYIRRYVIASQVMSLFKILLIFIPLIIGIIYLPPLFKNLQPLYSKTIDTYRQMLGLGGDKVLDAAAAEKAFEALPVNEQLEVRNKICN